MYSKISDRQCEQRGVISVLGFLTAVGLKAVRKSSFNCNIGEAASNSVCKKIQSK